jgi:hypothetical protein
MAQPALAPFTTRGCAIKAEVTEGTDSVPTAALNAVKLFDGNTFTEFDPVERNEDRAFFGGRTFGVTNERAGIEGDFELFSPATPGQVATGNYVQEQILLCGGMTVVKSAGGKTTRYNPISAAIPSVSAYFWHNDHKLEVLGARNALSAIQMQIGERFKGRMRLIGSYTDFEEEAFPAITQPYTSQPVYCNSANSYGKFAITDVAPNIDCWFKSLSLDFGSEIGSREYTQKKATSITGRAPTFSLRMARADLSDINPWSLRRGQMIRANMRTMESATLYSELGIRGQIENIQPTEIDGDHGWEISGRCIPSDTGGDEFYILFGDTTGV